MAYDEKLFLVKHPRGGHEKPTFVTSDKAIAYIVASLWIGDSDGGFSTRGSYKELDVEKDAVPPIMMQNIVRSGDDAKRFVSEGEFEKISQALYGKNLFGLTEEVWKKMSQDEQEEAFKWAEKAQTAAAENA